MTTTMRADFPDINYPAVIKFTAKDQRNIFPDVDALQLELSDIVLASLDPMPDEANKQHASLVKRFPEELPSFELRIESAVSLTRGEERQSNLLNRRAFLRKFSSYMNHRPLLSLFLFAVTKAMPLLLFVWLARKARNNPPASETDRIVRVLLGL